MTTAPDTPLTPCPSCGSAESARIVYGLIEPSTHVPDPDVVLGGCCITPADRACRRCETWFGSDGDPLDRWFRP